MNKNRVCTFLAVLFAVPLSVFAGQVSPVPVEVTFGEGFGSAFGDMVTARYTKDEGVFIGCGNRNFSDGSFSFQSGFCQARDAEGEQATCFTQDPVLIDAIKALDDYSFITFAWQDLGEEGLQCTNVGNSTQSFYLPEKLKANK